MTRHQNHGIRKTCDCGRRRWSTCPHSWKLNFKWAGQHYRLAIDKEVGRRIADRNKAKAEADTIRTAIRAARSATSGRLAHERGAGEGGGRRAPAAGRGESLTGCPARRAAVPPPIVPAEREAEGDV